MEIEFFLVDVRTRKPALAFRGTFGATADIGEAEAEAIIAGYNQCLSQILTALESDLRQVNLAAEQGTP